MICGWKYPAGGLNIYRFGACSYHSRWWASAYFLFLLFYFIYPLRGQLAERERGFFLCSNIPLAIFLFSSFLFQQPHHGRLHEKLRLIRRWERTKRTTWISLTHTTLLIISLLYTGHSFNNLATLCREAAAYDDYLVGDFAAVDRYWSWA